MYSRSGLGQTDALVSAIITEEGTCPSPSNCQNNNPGNLVYAGQPGASPGPNGFAVFDTYQDGYNALVNQIGLYASGSCSACNGQPQTLASMFQIYAPAGQGSNNPTAYANYVAGVLGVDPSTPVSSVLTSSAGASPDLSSVFSQPVNIAGFSIDPMALAAGIVFAALAIGLIAK